MDIFENTNDIDVLSSRSDLESLELELQKIGYKRAAETPIFARFENDDLIFAPIDVLLLDDQVFEKLAATATEGQLSNNSVLAPSPLNFYCLKNFTPSKTIPFASTKTLPTYAN